MKHTFLKTIGAAALAILISAMFAQISVFAQDKVDEQQIEEQAERLRDGIVGVWRTAVTPRNCQTGDPIPNVSPIRGLFTFHEGGTMAEFGVGPGSSPALRSPGHGVWEQRRGRRNFSFAFIHNRYDATGVFIGTQKITATLELGASGDSFTTNSSIETFDANDNLIGTGCATAVGTRFE